MPDKHQVAITAPQPPAGAALVPVVLPAEDDPRVISMRRDAQDLERRLAALPAIRTEQQLMEAGVWLDRANTRITEIGELVDPMVAAAHAAHKVATTQRNKMRAPFIAVREAARRLISDYHRRQEEARERLAQKELARYDEAEARGEAIELPAPPPPVARAEGHSVRHRYVFRVTDHRGLKPEFLVPDEVRIRGVVNALGPDAVAAVSLPGRAAIAVQRDDVVASKRR